MVEKFNLENTEGALSGRKQLLATERLFKITKKRVLFHLKSSSPSQNF